MAKFLLFLAVVAVVYFLVQSSKRRSRPPAQPPSDQAQTMVSCAYCGVNFPRSESVSAQGREFCCDDHRRLGGGA